MYSQKSTSQKQTQWNAAQFLNTLNFFGEVPFFGSFRWLQEWLGQRSTFSGVNLSEMKHPILVIGQMTSESLAAIQQRLPDRELSYLPAADVSSALSSASKTSTLMQLKHKMTCVDGIVITEADNFSALIAQIAPVLQTTKERVCRPVFDFTKESADFAAWGSLDDVVMGGISQGSLIRVAQADSRGGDEYAGAQALFTGVVSTSNSGGFSSVRTQNFDPPFNLTGYQGLQLQIKGDGQRYKFIARNSGGWDSPAYIYSFDTQPEQWITVEVPFAELVATFRARSVPDAEPFDPSRIYSFQLMLSKFEYDRQLNPSFSAGEFAIAIKRINAYRNRDRAVLTVVGAQDDTIRGQQQAALAEAQVNYRFIEPSEMSRVEAIANALE